jgi:hypothetical protein
MVMKILSNLYFLEYQPKCWKKDEISLKSQLFWTGEKKGQKVPRRNRVGRVAIGPPFQTKKDPAYNIN